MSMKLPLCNLSFKSFTLIELLIVIVIIGILAVSLLPRITGIQAKARDTKRIADMKTIQTALEMYYADHGRYPTSNGCGTTVPNGSRCNSVESLSGGHWIAHGALAPYLPGGDPVDPKGVSQANFSNTQKGTYFYFSTDGTWNDCRGGQYYMLITGLERQTTITNIGTLCNGNIYNAGGNYRINHTR